jgi:hypothetical protein
LSYEDWKRSHLSRGAVFAGVFFAGMFVEGIQNYSVWGVLLVAFFTCAVCVGFLMLADSWLERWYEHAQNERGEWAEF